MKTPRTVQIFAALVALLVASCGGSDNGESAQQLTVGAPTADGVVVVGHVDVLERLLGGKERKSQRDAARSLMSESAFTACVTNLGLDYTPHIVSVTHPENAIDSEVYPNGFGWRDYLSQTSVQEKAHQALLEQGISETDLINCEQAGEAATAEDIDAVAFATLDAIRDGWQQNASLRIDESTVIQDGIDEYIDCMATAGFNVADRIEAFQLPGRDGWDGSAADLDAIDEIDRSVANADAQCWTPVAEAYVAEQDTLFEAITENHQDALQAMDGFWAQYAKMTSDTDTKPDDDTTTTFRAGSTVTTTSIALPEQNATSTTT